MLGNVKMRLTSMNNLGTRLLAVGAALVVLVGAVVLLDGGAATARGDALPTDYPAFVMELEITNGETKTSALLAYKSADEWLYEEFAEDGSFLRSQRLEAGEVIITIAGFGQTVLPAGEDVTIPTAWFIDSGTMLGRGATRLGSAPSFELQAVVPCGPDSADDRCAGRSSVSVTTRADYDESTGVPIGYTVIIEGETVGTVRATRFDVN